MPRLRCRCSTNVRENHGLALLERHWRLVIPGMAQITLCKSSRDLYRYPWRNQTNDMSSSDLTGTPYHSGFCKSYTGVRSNNITYRNCPYMSVSLCSVAVLCNRLIIVSYQVVSHVNPPALRDTNFYLDSSSAFLPQTPISPFHLYFFFFG